jgi:predicted DNA-binding protein
MTKTVYIRPEDAELWERLASAAVQQRRSVSAILAELIEQYIGRVVP